MIKINWEKDYRNEFVCPKCRKNKLILSDYNQRKRVLKCLHCQKFTNKFCNLKKGYLSQLKAEGLGCPSINCDAREMVFLTFRTPKNGPPKKEFQCQVCGSTALESTEITKENLSRYARQKMPIRKFFFEDDEWDLRTINTAILNEKRIDNQYFVNFSNIKLSWFKLLCKQYIYFLCKLNTAFQTIYKDLLKLKDFSRYLVEKNISSLDEIDRNLILDYITWGKTSNYTIRARLKTLRKLFTTGNIQGWFQIDLDLIQDRDYPKKNPSNPDPLSDTVREQIEKKLYKLPDPIARMWIICFFAAMRPHELAFLKKDCLFQIGENWKLIWDRKKGKKFHKHSVPITRTIAKVIQEQKEYIEQLWGKDWDYLFCHYQNISKLDPSHPKLKPVKKIISAVKPPLTKAISTLIIAEKILDDNGQLAKFKASIIRETRLTELFHKGHDLAVVSAWAGHKTLATTANFYTQVTCEQIEKEIGHIQSALVNPEGETIYYESMPKTFWENPKAHELELSATHINTPIYGYCGLELNQACHKFRACYTCHLFVAKAEKLAQYLTLRDHLRDKEKKAFTNGHDVLVEQFNRQANQLDKIIASLEATT